MTDEQLEEAIAWLVYAEHDPPEPFPDDADGETVAWWTHDRLRWIAGHLARKIVEIRDE